MEQTTPARVYVDKFGEEIDLSVIYGVYKTPQGLTGFFQRCTSYDPLEIREAIDYILANVRPKPYDKANARRMIKQIEGSLPKEYQWQANGCLTVAVILSMLYLGYLAFTQFGLMGTNAALASLESTPYMSGVQNALSGTINTLSWLLNIHFAICVLATITNGIGYISRKSTFSFIAGGLYVLGLFTLAGNWIFLAALIALTLIGAKQLKEDE